MKNNLSEKLLKLGLVFPIYAWVTIFFIIPIVINISFIFISYSADCGIVFSIEKLLDVFRTHYMLFSALKTIAFTILCSVCSVVIASIMVYYTVKSSAVIRKAIFLSVLIQTQISFIAKCFSYKLLFSHESYLLQILRSIGIVSPTFSLMFTWFISFLTTLLLLIGFSYLALHQGLKLNENILLAAKDLGASNWVQFTQIFLPNIKKPMLSSYYLTVVNCLGIYFVLNMVGGIDQMLMENKISDYIFSYRDMPTASIYSIFLFISTLLMYGCGKKIISSIFGSHDLDDIEESQFE